MGSVDANVVWFVVLVRRVPCRERWQRCLVTCLLTCLFPGLFVSRSCSLHAIRCVRNDDGSMRELPRIFRSLCSPHCMLLLDSDEPFSCAGIFYREERRGGIWVVDILSSFLCVVFPASVYKPASIEHTRSYAYFGVPATVPQHWCFSPSWLQFGKDCSVLGNMHPSSSLWPLTRSWWWSAPKNGKKWLALLPKWGVSHWCWNWRMLPVACCSRCVISLGTSILDLLVLFCVVIFFAGVIVWDSALMSSAPVA